MDSIQTSDAYVSTDSIILNDTDNEPISSNLKNMIEQELLIFHLLLINLNKFIIILNIMIVITLNIIKYFNIFF